MRLANTDKCLVGGLIVQPNVWCEATAQSDGSKATEEGLVLVFFPQWDKGLRYRSKNCKPSGDRGGGKLSIQWLHHQIWVVWFLLPTTQYNRAPKPHSPPPHHTATPTYHTLGGLKKNKVKNLTGAPSNPIPLVKRSSEQFLFLKLDIWKALM